MSKPVKLPILRGRNAEVLLALRAGPMTIEQLSERFGSDSAARTLAKHGLIEYETDRVVGSVYRLTDKGRALCPSRRDLCATAEAFIAAQEARERGWDSAGRKAIARERCAA